MSRNTLVLDNPIMIDGKEVKELDYEATKITGNLFVEAYARSAAACKEQMQGLIPKENNYAFQLYLGYAAVIAANPNIDFSDLERIEGFDNIDLSNIGAFFTLRMSAGVSQPSGSESTSENTQDTSTQAYEKSEKCD